MNIKNISNFSIFCFFMLFTLRQLTLAAPMLYARESGTSSWIIVITVAILVAIYLLFLILLYKPFKMNTLLEISKYIFGNIGHKIISFTYFLVFLSLCCIFLKEISEGIKLLLFNTMSIIFIQIFYCIAMYFSTIIGLEAIVRSSGYLVPVCFFFLLLILGLSISFFNVNNLFPILGNGIPSILKGSFTLLPSYLGVLMVIFTVPHIKENKKIAKVVFLYVIIGAITILLSVSAINLVFGYPYISSNLFAFYELANKVNVSRFIKNAEGIYLFSILVLGLLFLMAFFYFATYCFDELINRKKKINMINENNTNYIYQTKSSYIINFILLIGIILIANIPQNIFEAFYLKEYINKYFILPTIFILPLFILILANIKKRRSNEKSSSTNN